ncbi:HemK2/MTQ2 family protein methyltransferase [Haloplanus natans]|uniref:HemK2/MTQ2 family protein methyltransferase n=1 Tax=Haloplanus natans TaxID=376171 RepID=UPI0009FD5466|nr:HemK2/MTQ2 family protein methyltransferase [Haloplanus natans]
MTDGEDRRFSGSRSETGDTRDALADRRGLEREVYQPAEDSRLLAEAAVEHARGRTLEVGTGSGWVAERIATETDAEVVASDYNPAACRQARERGVQVVRADLVESFRDGSLDTVAFNPPYLPTDPDNEWDDRMERALSGGESGREVIDPFLDTVGRVLRPGGRVLLLVSSLTGFESVVARAEANGFAVSTVRQESYPFEVLSILRLDG